jgi:uncharacterized protein (AIM24 family)
METQIKIRNEASVCTIDIEGVIGVPEGEQFGDAAHSVATYERLREEIERIKGAKNVMFGGEGLFNTVLTGPGTIYLQTMPLSNIADVIAAHMPKTD